MEKPKNGSLFKKYPYFVDISMYISAVCLIFRKRMSCPRMRSYEDSIIGKYVKRLVKDSILKYEIVVCSSYKKKIIAFYLNIS